MYESCRTVAILVLLNLFQLHDTTATIKSLNEKFSYPQQEVNYNDFSIKDGIFVYAVCDDNDLATEKNCTVIQRRFPYDEVVHSCNITLRVKYPENVNMTRVWVHAFGKENAILLWGETHARQTLNLMTIHLDSCKTNILELNDQDLQNYYQQTSTHKILTYDNSYDIFYDNVKEKDESDKNLIGSRFDSHNRLQSTQKIVKNEGDDFVVFMSPVATRSPNKGLVYTAVGENDGVTLTLVKVDGEQKILMKGHIILTSANSGFITSCTKSTVDTPIICTQFDENGDVKFKVTFDHDIDEATGLIIVHTTPNGGFLMVMAKREKSGEIVDYGNIKSCNVLRVDSDGKKVGGVRFNVSGEDGTWKIFNVWENGDEYCLTSAHKLNSMSGIEIAANCFTDDDFSA